MMYVMTFFPYSMIKIDLQIISPFFRWWIKVNHIRNWKRWKSCVLATLMLFRHTMALAEFKLMLVIISIYIQTVLSLRTQEEGEKMVQWVRSSGWQAWWPEFSPQDPHGRRREPASTNCPPQHVEMCVRMHTPTSIYNRRKIVKRYE